MDIRIRDTGRIMWRDPDSTDAVPLLQSVVYSGSSQSGQQRYCSENRCRKASKVASQAYASASNTTTLRRLTRSWLRGKYEDGDDEDLRFSYLQTQEKIE